MLLKYIFLGAFWLAPICLAVPHSGPALIDLNHRVAPNKKPRHIVETLSEATKFWFGNFDVGNSKNLTLLVDTGSSDVIVNPGLYKGGPHSVDIHSTFTNTYGTTESDGSGTGTVTGKLYNDTVKFGAVTAHQTIGSAQPDANGEALIPADGIVGLAGLEVSSFNGASPFFHSLCEQGEVSPCRFGITLGDNGKGTLLLGALDKALFKGDLITTSIIQEWALYADITLDGKIVKKDALVELDTGTATVIGPLEDVIAIFKAASMQYIVQKSESAGTSVTGYFPCDRPPSLGLSIPSQSNATAAARQKTKLVSHHSSIFNIAPDQWIAADNGSNNCTAILSGTDAFPLPDLWVVGQPFFHGTYVDHNLRDRTLGFAQVECRN